MTGRAVAGVDIGAECVKAIILADGGKILGRSVLPTRGAFRDRVHEVMSAALDEAEVALSDLAGICTTGFGARCAPMAVRLAGETTCHVAGAYWHHRGAMTVIDIGGREPRVVHCDDAGVPGASRSVRKCAVGIGTFLMFAARHLDVHPTRLEELAAAAEEPAAIGSCCSVFGGSDVLERLREGVSPSEIALGCMQSVAERVLEIGGFAEPLIVTGGVAEYFPGVLKSLSARTGMSVRAIPEPIFAGALGAALVAWEGLDAS
jgi:predicted CoA-substrate-specific enzyme activase